VSATSASEDQQASKGERREMSEPQPDEQHYGRSPALDALPDLRACNALPHEQRLKAAAEWMRKQLAAEQAE